VCVAAIATPGLLGSTGVATTELVSVNNAAERGHSSITPAISADGRFVAFGSPASNLVPDDTNGVHDIFVRDRQSGITERVSINSVGEQGNDHSGPSLFATFGANLAISADGRHVAFASRASNLVDDDTNGIADVFVHDRATRQTERVSVGSGGQSDNTSALTTISISADGRLVAFDSFASNLVAGDTNGFLDVFVRDRESGITERISVNNASAETNGTSFRSAISRDGRFVAFASSATNLVEGDVNGALDVFVHDRQSSTVELISVANDGAQGDGSSGTHDFGSGGAALSISDDGRFIAFSSLASNLVQSDINGLYDSFVRDRASGTTERVSVTSSGEDLFGNSDGTTMSADGRYVAFTTVRGSLSDVFVRDRQTHTTELASIDPSEVQIAGGGAAISADGRSVAFYSFPAGVFVRDRGAALDTQPPVVTVPADITADATSPDGAMVTFVASAVDNVDGVVHVTCSHESGSIFTVGTTTVTCSATDAGGNTGSASFNVVVRAFFAVLAEFHAEFEREQDELDLKAAFRVGETSDGIQPRSEVVTIRLDTLELTIPAGSFREDGAGRVRARVRVGGFDVDARIRLMRDGSSEIRFDLRGRGVALIGPEVEVVLTIGDDRGATTAHQDTD
jgi:Tol biopolymer transport system component